MEFDFTQMRKTLKKVLVEVGFETVMIRFPDQCLNMHSHEGLMTIEAESDLFDPK